VGLLGAVCVRGRGGGGWTSFHLSQLRRVEESPLLGDELVGGGGACGSGRGVVLVMRLDGGGGGGEVRERVVFRVRLLRRLLMRL